MTPVTIVLFLHSASKRILDYIKICKLNLWCLLSGTITMGHPNLGLKLPPNNDAKHSLAYGPNSLRARESRSTHLAHGPMPRYGPSEASPAAEQSLSRSRAPCRGPPMCRQSPPRLRLPQSSPPRTLGTRETPPRSSPPSAD